MILEPWEEENLENLRRILERGMQSGIEKQNGELIDYCAHALDILSQFVEFMTDE